MSSTLKLPPVPETFKAFTPKITLKIGVFNTKVNTKTVKVKCV